MPVQLPFERTAKFGYDFSTYPQRVFLDFGMDPLPITGTPTSLFQFTLSGDTVQGTKGPIASTTLIDDFPRFMSNETALTLLSEGDNVAYSRDFVYFSPIDAIVDHMTFQVAAGQVVSSYTAGTFALTNVQIEITPFRTIQQSESETVQTFTEIISSTSRTTIGNMYAVVYLMTRYPMRIYANAHLRIRITVNGSLGTGSSQVGILPCFAYQNYGGLRTYSLSGANLYIRPIPKDSGLIPIEYTNLGGINR